MDGYCYHQDETGFILIAADGLVKLHKIRPGQIALVEFPQTDLAQGKRRPVLLLAQPPGPHDDWWVCMFSTQLDQALPAFDEVICSADSDFATSGLRRESVIRVARVAPL